MSDEHKRALRRNSTELIYNLNPDVTFMAELMKNKLITEYYQYQMKKGSVKKSDCIQNKMTDCIEKRITLQI